MNRSRYCTYPDREHCDCDACRHVAKLRRELKHARVQMRRARGREEVTAIDVYHVLPYVSAVRRHALALASLQKWTGAVVRARRSLALMGLPDA